MFKLLLATASDQVDDESNLIIGVEVKAKNDDEMEEQEDLSVMGVAVVLVVSEERREEGLVSWEKLGYLDLQPL